MSPRVVLVGPPGAGKSTVGAELASRLAVPFADSDALIESRVGKSVAEVFVDDGEDAFRALEAQVIAEALASFDGVLSLGGGAVLDPGTRSRLKVVPVVLLSATVATSAGRVGLNRDRPLLVGNVRGRLTHLLGERAPLYAEVADLEVPTDEKSVELVVDAVAAFLVERSEG